MPFAKLAVACGLATVALSACGGTAKPVAGSPGNAAGHSAHGVIDDPRSAHLGCLQQHHLTVVAVGPTSLQVGAPPSGPTIDFEPTPGAAQTAQIEDRSPSAEVIGSALLYPHRAADSVLQTVEDCLAAGVTG